MTPETGYVSRSSTNARDTPSTPARSGRSKCRNTAGPAACRRGAERQRHGRHLLRSTTRRSRGDPRSRRLLVVGPQRLRRDHAGRPAQ
jgi:hypothetical protein